MNILLKHAPQQAFLGLGGNMGNPVQAMADALNALHQHEACSVLAVSPVYRTPPWGKLDQADFYNACALVSTTLSAHDLLDLCLALERAMKRVRLERWGPRTLDIDILTYGDLAVESQTLSLPHPRMLERAFVLKPLADIAADLTLQEKTVAQWLNVTECSGIEQTAYGADWWQHEQVNA